MADKDRDRMDTAPEGSGLPPARPGDASQALPRLTAEDGQVLDAVLGSLGPDRRVARGVLDAKLAGPGMPADAAARAGAAERLLAVVGADAVGDAPEDLVERTLALVRDTEQRRRFAAQVHALTTGPIAFRWSEMITVAAILMIGISLVWPVLSRTRSDARQMACANNLTVAGSAFGRYAQDHGGALPRGKVHPGDPWWNVGAERAQDGAVHSNTQHLYLLVRQLYVSPRNLACPDNEVAPRQMSVKQVDWNSLEEVSYSYQNQYTARPARLGGAPRMVILGDRNPLFVVRIAPGRSYGLRDGVSSTASSRAHPEPGQNVLAADGAVSWTGSPVVDGDNIWLAAGVETYEGTEVPAAPDDSFLVP